MVKDLRSGGTLYADGVLVQENGALAALTPRRSALMS